MFRAQRRRTSSWTCRCRVAEAILGTKVNVPTVEGPVQVTIPPGTSSGAKLRLRGKGIKRQDDSRGDQICSSRSSSPSGARRSRRAGGWSRNWPSVRSRHRRGDFEQSAYAARGPRAHTKTGRPDDQGVEAPLTPNLCLRSDCQPPNFKRGSWRNRAYPKDNTNDH